MPDLVFEIGTEEMPAAALPGAISQLRENAPSRLADARLPARAVRVFGTPRRLAILAEGMPDRQPDVEREVRGPSAAVAYDAVGSPTGAAMGFARKQGVAADQLTVIETPQGRYVSALVRESGKTAEEALGPVLLDLVRALTFPKTMRWGDGATRYVRPVRWLLALLDDRVVPLEFAGVASGRETRGHRYLAPDPIAVARADGYLESIRAGWVIADPDERRAMIVEQADRAAAQVGGSVPWDTDLLEENVHLVEWPTCLIGSFDADFLQLPRPVLVTSMKKHQRFFPVEGSDGALLPLFVSVRNGGHEHLAKVRAGNEAVLTARFADARHFHGHDRETPLEAMAGKLDRLVFQEKLGTMADKRREIGAARCAHG